MELTTALGGRRMVRSFSTRPIARELVTAILADRRFAPSAGNSRATAWVALEGPEQTARYFDHATTPEWRASSKRWPGLSRAPVVLLALTSPAGYAARYGEPDKAASGLSSEEVWPVPYWFGDAAFETMIVLLRAFEEGLGTCFLGNFRQEVEVLAACGVPEGWRLFGAVLLGYPDGGDHRSTSLDRPARDQEPHFGGW